MHWTRVTGVLTPLALIGATGAMGTVHCHEGCRDLNNVATATAFSILVSASAFAALLVFTPLRNLAFLLLTLGSAVVAFIYYSAIRDAVDVTGYVRLTYLLLAFPALAWLGLHTERRPAF